VKKTDIDLIVGASILCSIVILIGGVLWLKEVSVSREMVDYAVLFPNVGTLQVGDPAMVNGVKKGAVKAILLRNSDVAVVLELEKNLKLTDSCRIAIQNIGLMGERGIGLQYSQQGGEIKPIRDADTTFLRGRFDTGIAEAIGMLGEVLGEVQTLAVNLSSIVNQTVGDTGFIARFKAIVGRLDTLSLAANELIGDNRAAIDRSIGNLQALSEQAKGLVERNTPGIDSIVANGEALTSRALLIADNIDTLTLAVRTVLGRIDNEESSIGKLMRDREIYTDLKKTVADLDTLVTSVQKDALKLRIRFGFGKKRNEKGND
jgi:phospholipid/cholesterol/gamma-HCH transport system substrate-binding protein